MRYSSEKPKSFIYIFQLSHSVVLLGRFPTKLIQLKLYSLTEGNLSNLHITGRIQYMHINIVHSLKNSNQKLLELQNTLSITMYTQCNGRSKAATRLSLGYEGKKMGRGSGKNCSRLIVLSFAHINQIFQQTGDQTPELSSSLRYATAFETRSRMVLIRKLPVGNGG